MGMNIFLIVSAGVASMAVLISLLKSHRLVRGLILSAVQGIAAIYAVNLVGMVIGTDIPVNAYTLGVGSVAGTPGVITLLLLEVMFR